MSNKDDNDDDNLDSSTNLSDELARLDAESLEASISDNDNDVDNSIQGDTWIEELECALLADFDPITLKKISEGKRIPATLRPDYWRALLSLEDTGKIKISGEYDLDNQLEMRRDCEALVEDIAANIAKEPLTEADKLQLKSNFESTLTTYVKARPELSYIPGNGWTDILKVLYHLNLNDVQLYQMFFRIVDRYIPKDLSPRPDTEQQRSNPDPIKHSGSSSNIEENKNKNVAVVQQAKSNQQKETSTANLPKASSDSNLSVKKSRSDNKSIQAYHLLRLLIQYHDPELCSILDSKKVLPNLYVKEWFCSLFARSCSPEMALIIWDTHFKMADPFLIFFAAIVMVANASDELKNNNMSQAEMLNVLKAMPSQLEVDDIEDLYYLVSNHYTNSTPRSIRSYSHLFFMDTFGNTYSGNESPEGSPPPLLDVKTCKLTNLLDLSQYLCLPIVPAELFTLETAQSNSSPTHQTLRYFLVDCRPAEQYNSGHLQRAFHLDCSLMLREPTSFATAVQALLEIQRQVVASKSQTGGQHLCFIGSGQEEEDQYVNMVVASFLQKYQKYVSIVVGGFDAIHEYVDSKSDLKDSFGRYIVDHNPDLCKTCLAKTPEGLENYMKMKQNANQRQATASSGLSSAQSLFASTTSFLRGDKGGLTSSTFSKLTSDPRAAATANLIAQSSASMFDKFTTAFVSKSSVIKDRLVETLNTTTLPGSPPASSGGRDHVSSQDKLGKRYTGGSIRYAIDETDIDDLSNKFPLGTSNNFGTNRSGEPVQEIQIDSWQKQMQIIAFHKCSQVRGNMNFPGYLALSKTHLWILREIPHNKGFASIAAKRPLDMIVQITSKRRQPDLIIFRYGDTQQAKDNLQQPSKSLPSIVASDQLHIPQAFEVIRLIKREIVRIMDETSKTKAAQIESSEQSPSINSDPRDQGEANNEPEQTNKETITSPETASENDKETKNS